MRIPQETRKSIHKPMDILAGSPKSYLQETAIASCLGISGFGVAAFTYHDQWRDQWRDQLSVSMMSLMSDHGGSIALAIVGIVGFGAAFVFGTKHYDESKIHEKKLQFNNLVPKYNRKIEEYNKMLEKFKEKHEQLSRYEEILNQSKLLAMSSNIKKLLTATPNNNSNSNINIIALGPSGCGKSLICNRLIGNNNKIQDIMDQREYII